jgi:DNA excision repair protein ERCC-4
MDLKRNQDEPDAAAAALVGIPGCAGGLPMLQAVSLATPLESVVNQSAQDLVRKLPGVTEANFRPLMAAVGSLRALADASLEEIEDAMGGTGNSKNAKLLREFLDAPCPRF